MLNLHFNQTNLENFLNKRRKPSHCMLLFSKIGCLSFHYLLHLGDSYFYLVQTILDRFYPNYFS